MSSNNGENPPAFLLQRKTAHSYTKALAPGESTTSLITHVRTTFEEAVAVTDESINRTPRDYDIFVYAEGLQQEKLDGSGPWSDYSQAWSAFLAQKG